MVGFEITKNGKRISGSIDGGILSVYAFINNFSSSEHSKSICFFGNEESSNEIIYWLEEELNKGDEITIEVKNIEKNSQPTFITTKNE